MVADDTGAKMVETELDLAWQAFLDAIREADTLAEEICNCPENDPRRPGLIIALHGAWKRRDAARDLVEQLRKAQP